MNEYAVPKGVLTREMVEWALEMRLKGNTWTRIADALHCNVRTVQRSIRRVYGKLPDPDRLVFAPGVRS